MKEYTFTRKGINYSIVNNENGTLTVTAGYKSNTFKVKEHKDYIYTIKKTFVGCQSIDSLLNHFKECIETNFALDAWCIAPLNRMLEVKPCKI